VIVQQGDFISTLDVIRNRAVLSAWVRILIGD
jgi:hypothetical protein